MCVYTCYVFVCLPITKRMWKKLLHVLYIYFKRFFYVHKCFPTCMCIMCKSGAQKGPNKALELELQTAVSWGCRELNPSPL